MNDFDYEVLQRKRLASQAKYRKNGSRSKKCSLPSDGMSQKEWKERNGEVMTYNLSKPMSWEQFKGLPKDTQAQYIKKLQTEFGASLSSIGMNMFGLSVSCLRGYLVNKGIPFNADKHRRSEASVERFKQFCNGETEPEANPSQPADCAETAGTEAPSERPRLNVSSPRRAAQSRPRRPGCGSTALPCNSAVISTRMPSVIRWR